MEVGDEGAFSKETVTLGHHRISNIKKVVGWSKLSQDVTAAVMISKAPGMRGQTLQALETL